MKYPPKVVILQCVVSAVVQSCLLDLECAVHTDCLSLVSVRTCNSYLKPILTVTYRQGCWWQSLQQHTSAKGHYVQYVKRRRMNITESHSFVELKKKKPISKNLRIWWYWGQRGAALCDIACRSGGSSSDCSVSNPTSYYCPWEGSRSWPRSLGPCRPCGVHRWSSRFELQLSPAWSLQPFGHPQVECIFLFLFLLLSSTSLFQQDDGHQRPGRDVKGGRGRERYWDWLTGCKF